MEVEDVDATSVGSLIDFTYTGKICINQENIFVLLAASDDLQIEETKQCCFIFL